MQTLSCGMWDLPPWPGIKPRPPALGAWRLSHWTTREVSEATEVLRGRRAVWIFPQTHFCLILQSLLQAEVCAHHHGLPVSRLLTLLLLHLDHPPTAPQRSQVSQPSSSCSSSGMPCPATLHLEMSFPDAFPAFTAANSVTSSSVLTWPHLLHLLFFFFNIYLFGCAGSYLWDLSGSERVGSSSLTRDWTLAPCIRSIESQSLNHQGSPILLDFIKFFSSCLCEEGRAWLLG